jgi:imidazole glycerol-phosphate synthase
MAVVTVVDYGAGNVRSLENAVRAVGHDVLWARTPADIAAADRLIFPGVGSFGAAMAALRTRGFVDPLREYLREDRPFLGICIGLQTLFEGSEESPGVEGLAVLNGVVGRFSGAGGVGVPQIGWNTVKRRKGSVVLGEGEGEGERYYFVHSFRVALGGVHEAAVLATTVHGEEYVSVVQKGRMVATQFHPEKSGAAGLELIRRFIEAEDVGSAMELRVANAGAPATRLGGAGLAKRVVACLDVRENDAGDLVVTKGDQYDVRESKEDGGEVRNLGKPVELARRYYEEGADEVTFLNITSFRGEPVGEAAMIEVLERTSEGVFVPLCIGGGIRDYVDRDGRRYSALDVATLYFRAGADKVSLGSDAVYAAEKHLASGCVKDGSSAIESISFVYGAQAVVISVDPRRVYVENAADTPHATVTLADGRVCWYQCTVKGGREGRDLDVVQLVTACEALGAGEILINSMDADGQKQGFDHALVSQIRGVVSIPVIASSGAGKPSHFTDVFDATGAEAALAAGIFHRREVSIADVKAHMAAHGTPVRVFVTTKSTV